MHQIIESARPATDILPVDSIGQSKTRAPRRQSMMTSLTIAIPNAGENNEQEFCSQKETIVLKPHERRVSCFTRMLEPTFYDSFAFMFVSGPDYGFESPKGQTLLHKLDAKISEMKPIPKFIAICGGLTNDSSASKLKSSIETVNKALSKSAVKIVRIVSANDLASLNSTYPEWRKTMEIHRQCFGDDCFGFWISGVSFLVVDSALQDQFEQEQSEWLSGELLQNEISGTKHTIILQEKQRAVKLDDTVSGADKNSTAYVIQRHLAMDDNLHVFCRESTGESEHPRIISTPRITEAVENVRVVRVSAHEVVSHLLSIDDLHQHH